MMRSKWLNDAVFYEIYPQSFYDSNGDGIGDINVRSGLIPVLILPLKMPGTMFVIIKR